MQPKFSFIVPARNEAAYIFDCLRSISAQHRKDYEIIVVDTASTDGTPKIAKRYADKVINEPRRGPAAARNTGAAASCGDILIFADADVRFERNFLDQISDEFEEHPATIGGICRLEPYDACCALHARSYFVVNGIVKWLNALGFSMTAGSCFVYRRSAFERAGRFDARMLTNEDHDMARRASKFGRFAYFENIPVYTSVRRVAKFGFWAMLFTYAKSTAMYILNKSYIKDYW